MHSISIVVVAAADSGSTLSSVHSHGVVTEAPCIALYQVVKHYKVVANVQCLITFISSLISSS